MKKILGIIIAAFACVAFASAQPPQSTLAKSVCTCGVNCPCKAKPAPQTTNTVVRPTNPVVSRPVAAPVVIRQTAPVRGNCPNGQCSVPR